MVKMVKLVNEDENREWEKKVCCNCISLKSLYAESMEKFKLKHAANRNTSNHVLYISKYKIKLQKTP